MSVASHLGIRLSEYDRMIRTFVPHYEEMLDVVAETVRTVCGPRPAITDLGTGTGALAARCLAVIPRATLRGVDEDAGMLEAARRRLARYGRRVRLVTGRFQDVPLPRGDALVATLALHHIRSTPAKQRFYRACAQSLRRGGVLVNGDAFLSDPPDLAKNDMAAWRAHMCRFYRPSRVEQFLAAWSREDRYFTLAAETRMLQAAGLRVEVVWRRAPAGVLLARR